MSGEENVLRNRRTGRVVGRETRDEYMSRLRQWTDEVRRHNEMSLAAWSSYATQQYMQIQPEPTETAIEDAPPFTRAGFYIYIIPPMWKRIVAEIIDFLILFVIKMFLTIVVLESFDIVDMHTYDLNSFHKKLQSPRLAMQMSVEILLLEILHRFIVCCYETYWIFVRCATPGKRYMGLAVVHAVSVNHVQGQVEETVLAHPCTRLSMKDALLRASLKNVFIGLLLPICFVLLFFKFNRTGYDLMTNSLVVEYNPNPPVQEAR